MIDFFDKLFEINYEKKILKSLEVSLFNARKAYILAIEAKQHADATLNYSTTRVDYLNKAVADQKEVYNAKNYTSTLPTIGLKLNGSIKQ